ncbi:MAG: DUF2970 domain-containing protein [Gammaproteobacteria bacterium]
MSPTPNDAPATVQPRHDEPAPKPLSLLQIVGSTIAAAAGVQSSRNRARDFQSGRPTHFIVAGIVFTVAFVIGMVLLVRAVLSAAGG